MKIRISIKNFQREEMLLSLLEEIKLFKKTNNHDINVFVYDDCSDFSKSTITKIKKYCTFKSNKENFGKRHHWKLWDNDFKDCQKETDTDLFIFLPSDLSNVDFKSMINFAGELKNQEYFFNVTNDGRTTCWNNVPPQVTEKDYMRIFFTDCTFFTNYKSLSKLDFTIHDVGDKRFHRRTNISSGVGQQMTNRLNALRVDIYHPYESFAEHGDHESTMNKEERERIPLVAVKSKKSDKQVIVGVATFKGREDSLYKMLSSLCRQTIKPDKVFVYSNEINVDLTDNGKFVGLAKIDTDCYYFSCDDDLYYPTTYIEDMIQAIKKHGCIVTHHGRKLAGKNRDYYIGHKTYRCLSKNKHEIKIDVAGTGVTAFDTSYFKPIDIIFDKRKRMSDCLFSLIATKQNKEIVLLPHSTGYITQLDVDQKKSCHYIESKDCSVQNKIADEIFTIKNK